LKKHVRRREEMNLNGGNNIKHKISTEIKKIKTKCRCCKPK